MKRRLDPALPVMRAHGVKHLVAHLEGSVDARRGRGTLEARHAPLRQAAVHLGEAPARRFKWVAPEEAAEQGMSALGRTWA